MLRTLVAFANTAGGVLVIGVEDGTRHVGGVSDPMAVEERLANLLSDGIAAWMQAGSFAGVDRSQILDQLVLDGPLPEWVERSTGFVDRHTSRPAVIDGLRRREVPVLPPVAVREAIVNAVVHADYSQPGGPLRVALFSDRLEVENPGLLPFGLTIDEIRLGVSRVRTRVLLRVFRELGYVEQWGSGIGRMTRACVDAGHPAPEFAELAGRFRVVLRTSRSTPTPMLDADDARLLDALADGAGRSTSELAHVLGRSTRTARSRLAKLVALGLVVEIGSGPTDPQRRYHLRG